MMDDTISVLRKCGIQPTPQRIAVVDCVLECGTHPSADEILTLSRKKCPTVSRATVYNTLKLLVEKGLLKAQVLREGTILFDANTDKHHHIIDEQTGEIYDIPWDKLKVNGTENLDDFEVIDYHVVIRGKKRK